MRTKILFFLLGAGVATLAYIAGHTTNAAEQVTEIEYLRVTKGILIGEEGATLKTAIGPGAVSISSGDTTKAVITINEKGEPILTTQTKKGLAFVGVSEADTPYLYLKEGNQKKIITVSEAQTSEEIKGQEAHPKQSSFKMMSEKAAHKVHAQTLTQAYNDNTFAADEKYKGKIIYVESEIESFSEVLDILTVKLKHFGTDPLPEVLGISCQMQPSQRPFLAKLKKGDRVAVVGRLIGFEIFNIKMENCLIAEIKPSR